MPRSFHPVRVVVIGVAVPAAVLLAGCTGPAPPPRLSPAMTVDPLDLGRTRTAALTYSASVGGSGLEDVYRRRAQFTVFDPAVIHGYPAVHVEDGAGHCRVVVGVTDSEVLDVTVDARDPELAAHDAPCAEADTFAGAVVGYQGHRAP